MASKCVHLLTSEPLNATLQGKSEFTDGIKFLECFCREMILGFLVVQYQNTEAQKPRGVDLVPATSNPVMWKSLLY